MNNWITLWKASACMDSRGRDRTAKASNAVGEPVNPLRAVHAALRHGPDAPPFPEFLHESIMHAVRKTSQKSLAPHPATEHRLRLTTAAACLSLLLLTYGIWSLQRQSSADVAVSGFAEPTAALAESAQAHLEALGGLNDELESLNRDFKAAANHLLASIP